MITRLKVAIDLAESEPKIKNILLKIAELPEDKQNDALELVKNMLGVMSL